MDRIDRTDWIDIIDRIVIIYRIDILDKTDRMDIIDRIRIDMINRINRIVGIDKMDMKGNVHCDTHHAKIVPHFNVSLWLNLFSRAVTFILHWTMYIRVGCKDKEKLKINIIT